MTRTLTPYEQVGACGLVANLSMCELEDPVFEADADQQARAHDLARITLNALTAGVVANCPVTVRPCRPRDVAGAALWRRDSLSWGSGHYEALWLSSCGCASTCACGSKRGLDLNGPVAEITAVTVDGVTLDEEEYRLEGQHLFRADGTAWPVRQNMDLPLTDPDTWAVTYRPGYALGLSGESALGLLYREYLTAMCGDAKKCRLPNGITRLTRQGVTMEINRSMFKDGLTGTPEVDAYVEAINPNHLRALPSVYSPDVAQHRVV